MNTDAYGTTPRPAARREMVLHAPDTPALLITVSHNTTKCRLACMGLVGVVLRLPVVFGKRPNGQGIEPVLRSAQDFAVDLGQGGR